jgi:hypothetical protein
MTRTPTGRQVLSSREKMLLHVYKRASGITEAEYRAILRQASGLRSAAERGWTWPGWLRAMASLERHVFDRPDARPRGDPYIKEANYWRSRVPEAGRINARQIWIIEDLWATLSRYLPEECRSVAYFGGIAAKATGKRDVGLSAFSSVEAGLIIDALKNRIQTAVTAPQETPCLNP